jgi:hypothetical protein
MMYGYDNSLLASALPAADDIYKVRLNMEEPS